MTARDGDTIFALASGRPPAATAVVRISGAGVPDLARNMLGDPAPEPRRASLRTIRDPASGAVIDRGLALYFEAPASFTGEHVLELHVHGGRAIIGSLFDSLSELAGVRHAEAGEFTRRALLNGKLDLTGAEAIADLVAADTRAQLGQALRQLSGALADACERWRSELLRALAHVETELDFPDEDVDPMTGPRIGAAVRALADEIRRTLDDGHAGERVRDGVRVAIIGRPNVGKSSLLNRLAARDVAIVSEIAGTTRDLIETHIDVAGVPVVLIDTAGLRESADPIEREGTRRAASAAATADHRIFLTAWPEIDAEHAGSLEVPGPDPARDLQVINKADLAGGALAPVDGIAISAKTGDGIDALLARLAERIAGSGGGEAPIITRARHRDALTDTVRHLESAAAAIGSGRGAPELWAEDLRLAARALGRITGRVDVEDVLDIVFAEFCIGK